MAIFYESLQKFPSAQTVCIAVHGLNNRPDVLTDVISVFESLQTPVISVGLTGHNQDPESLKQITEDTWRNDVLKAYDMLPNRNVKLVFVGYSLGAALGIDILSEQRRFDKMVLLAPAIAPRKPVQFLGRVAGKFPALPLYSAVPERYRANTHLPLRAYDMLHHIYMSVKKKQFAHANIPTLVFMDPKDETMSLDVLNQTIETCQLSNWHLLPLDSDHVDFDTRFHHMIMDKKTMGPKNWELFVHHVRNFLNEETKGKVEDKSSH